MELSIPGSYFHLTILGYQYPDAEGEPYDANWLLIRVDAVGPQGAWSVTDPCLLTSEVERLAAWLESVHAGSPQSPALSFLEPALLFRLVEREGNELFLRIHFGSLVHPTWASEAPKPGANPDLWLDFPLAGDQNGGERLDLAAAARSLREQLARYPRRKEL